MTTGATTSRFCSCSEFPTHLDGVTTSDAGSYCSCSATPAHISSDRQSDLQAPNASEVQQPHIGQSPTLPKPRSRTHFEAANAASPTLEPTIGEVIPRVEPVQLDSVSDLLPDETEFYTASTHGKGGSEVVLTERRVLLRGAADAKVLHASLRVNEIDSITISRAAPNRRSLIWGLIGIGATVGMWQALDGVGNLRLIIAAIVLAMSALLLADYFLRPPDLEVVLRARSGSEMRVAFGQTHAEEADGFAARIIAMTEMASTDS